ncbi:MAG: alpha/beta fold hydrolase [Nanoarchaeota archaeon]|nr:alpha/beta fold hydrolase [Nanoarchaeota archaeon]
MKKPLLKAYYGGIFFEFVLQDRLADAVIILPGFPGRNDYNELVELFFDRGYHVFVPRYRGSYQSSGTFLSKNPVDDLIMFSKNLDKGFAKSLWDMKKQSFKINKKILIAGSFGGSIACGLAAKQSDFSYIVLASPVWDFTNHNKDGGEQDLKHLTTFCERAYRNCYRINFKDLQTKMAKFKELSPEYYISALMNLPILVFHDPNDKIVSFNHTKEMLPKLNKVTYIEHYLGHGLTDDLINAFWKEVDKFIKINYV